MYYCAIGLGLKIRQSQLVFHVNRKLQTSVQSVLVSIFRIGLLRSEVESSRTSLASRTSSRTSSRTDFEVLGLVLGLGVDSTSGYGYQQLPTTPLPPQLPM